MTIRVQSPSSIEATFVPSCSVNRVERRQFRNPATYFVTHWISVPHIHLRLCSNAWAVAAREKCSHFGQVSWAYRCSPVYVLKDTFAHTTQDAIIFVRNGAELVAGEATGSEIRP